MHKPCSSSQALLIGVLSTLLVGIGLLGLYGISGSNAALAKVLGAELQKLHQEGQRLVVEKVHPLATPFDKNIDALMQMRSDFAKAW